MITPDRPVKGEYADFYDTYISKITTGNLFEILRTQQQAIQKIFSPLAESKWLFRYAEGKWSVKEALLHMIDAERVFSYRALRIARGDQTPLPGFNQDDYVPLSDADKRSSASLLAEYNAVRAATMALFESFDDKAWIRHGTASNGHISVRALGYIIAGHEKHHIEILKERYGLEG